MNLLIFAHRGEAQIFIKQLNAKALESELYQYESGFIYICTEGIYDVMSKLGAIIQAHKISSVINLGIAGALSKQLEINKVYSIRSSYLENFEDIEFKSFELKGELDCITSSKRVLSENYSNKLKPIAPLVDRELWGIAKVCKDFETPLMAYKLISDYAGAQTDCFDLKQRAGEFSQRLWEFYHQNLSQNKIEDNAEKVSIKYPFNMSQYQKNQYQKLIKNIDAKRLDQLINEINKHELSDKEKTNELIMLIKKEFYPLKYKIIKQIETSLAPLKSNHIQIKYDENLEKEYLNINIQINSEKNIEQSIKALEKFSYADFIKIFKGSIDV